MSRWVEHAILWHTYPLGLGGAPIRDEPTPGRRLRALLDRLDHVVALGANGLLLGPIFTSATHGYDTLDHLTIDPRLGGREDFDELVARCRARGLRLVLDGVFGHVAPGHRGPIHRGEEGRPSLFEGHDSLWRLDHDDPATADLVVEVMNHWCAAGADGWRLDAAYSVDTAFWSRVLPQVRAAHPDVWVVGEVLHGDYAAFVRESGMDGVTQYELWKAIWSSLLDRNLYELDWALRRHAEFLDTFVPQTFVGNHDVTRITERLGPDGAVAALAVLMTVGGVPSIYYGDELGLTGLKEDRIGGDDAVRPAWPAIPPPGADRILDAHRVLIGMRRRHPWLLRARTTAVELDNARAVFRSTAADGGDHLDLELDLTQRPRARVLAADGTVVWS